MNSEEVEDKEVLDIPKWFPFTHRANEKLEKVFIRKCYPGYYNEIMSVFDADIEYITCTGTPGIGKSMFMVYFYERYRREHPNTKIILASFNEDKTLIKCRVYDPCDTGSTPKRVFKVPYDIEDEEVLYMFDSLPEKHRVSNKMICFPSPNVEWLQRMMSKEAEVHRAIYMPLWTLEELQYANEVLRRDISSVVIESRFNKYGGTARVCFASEGGFNEMEISVRDALKHIKSYDALECCIDMEMDPRKIVHRLLYYEPTTSCDPKVKRDIHIRYNLIVASDWIWQQIQDNIQINTFEEQLRFYERIRLPSPATSLKGHIFENLAHKIFQNGGNFECESLNKTQECESLDEKPTKFRLTVIKSAVDKYKKPSPKLDIYMIPKSKIAESIDSFYWDGKFLYLFQMTVSDKHPVKATGICKLLESLALDMKKTKVVLIFVVPEYVSFSSAQKITVPQMSNEVVRMKLDNGPTSKRPRHFPEPPSKQRIVNADAVEESVNGGLTYDSTKELEQNVDDSGAGNFDAITKISQYVIRVNPRTYLENAMPDVLSETLDAIRLK